MFFVPKVINICEYDKEVYIRFLILLTPGIGTIQDYVDQSFAIHVLQFLPEQF